MWKKLITVYLCFLRKEQKKICLKQTFASTKHQYKQNVKETWFE